jgi:hypothetical protein
MVVRVEVAQRWTASTPVVLRKKAGPAIVLGVIARAPMSAFIPRLRGVRF